jgi:uncharacterized protein YijF (DUF1287 family)
MRYNYGLKNITHNVFLIMFACSTKYLLIIRMNIKITNVISELFGLRKQVPKTIPDVSFRDLEIPNKQVTVRQIVCPDISTGTFLKAFLNIYLDI